MGIQGNEAADKLADKGANCQRWEDDLSVEPTVSGIRSHARSHVRTEAQAWWEKRSAKLSSKYKR